MKYVIVSGYFDPLHVGHIDYLKESKKLGDVIVVIVNNDEQAKLKKGRSFMPLDERIEVIKSVRYVDMVVPSIDKDSGILKTIRKFVEEHKDDEFILANGGDVTPDDRTETKEEQELCKELNIKCVYGLGKKIQSSSWLIKRASENE